MSTAIDPDIGGEWLKMSDFVQWTVPKSWRWVTISDLGKVVSGGTPSTKDPANWGGQVPWITPADLSGYTGKYISRGAKSLTEKGLANSSATAMPTGSILFSSRAPVGYVAISADKISTSQGFKSLVPTQGVLSEYVFYYLKGSKTAAEKLASGTTFLELSGTAFGKLSVPLPPLDEQRRIVAKVEELFSELDAGVESLKTAREQLKVYRQALLKHAFEGKLTAAWRTENADKLESAEELRARIRAEREQLYRQQLVEWEEAVEAWDRGGREDRKPPKPENIETFSRVAKEELAEFPALPRGWHWLRLTDIVASLDQGWSPKCESKPADENQWGVITTTAVQSLSFRPEANKVLPPGLSPRPWLEISCDDILITRAGPRSRAGIVCRVNSTRKRLMICDKVYRLRVPSGVISPRFVEALLNSPDVAMAIERLKTGINDSGVNLTQNGFLSLVIPVPSTAEQVELVQALEGCLTQIESMEREVNGAITKSEALRQSILKRAFSGRLVPQDPSDEPASALLERIRAERAAAGNGGPRKRTARRG